MSNNVVKQQGELVLFQFTNPVVNELGIKSGRKTNDKGAVTGLSLTLEGPRDIGKRLGVPAKDQAVIDSILAASDKLKEIGLQEAVRLAQSPEWTGARVAITRSKNGARRFTLALKTTDKRTIDPKKVAEALAGMTEDQQIAVMEAADKLRGEKAKTIDVGSEANALDNSKAETEAVEA